jgi:hypothetical protein
MVPVVIILVVICIAFFVITQQMARKQQPQQAVQRGPATLHGSMGRMGEPMPPAQAAQTIYGNLQSRGGLEKGRVYSASYFQGLMPGPVMGFSDDWIWWNAVFASLNDLLIADSIGFPCYAYNYGGQPCLFFGAPDDPLINPIFYNDPMMYAGEPFNMDPGNFVTPDSTGFDASGDQMGIDQGFQGDPNSSQDSGQQNGDDSGVFSDGGGSDS